MDSHLTPHLAGVNCGLILLDADGRVRGTSEAVHRWCGGIDLVGRPAAEVLSLLTISSHGPGPFTHQRVSLGNSHEMPETAYLIIPVREQLAPEEGSICSRELQAVIDIAFDELHITDGLGTTLVSSTKSMEFFGLSSDEMVGMPLQALRQRQLARPVVTEMVQQTRRSITTIQQTVTGRRLMVTGQPVFDRQGNLIRIVNTARDVTIKENLTAVLEHARTMMQVCLDELIDLRGRTDQPTFSSRSEAMASLLAEARRVAMVDSTVLIEGETGVGKEVLARSIHEWSPRRDGPFVTIDCGAIPESLIESELFGYEEGAFTGARKGGKMGLIEAAHRGTLFLDEIGDLPPHMQVKLLRVLQQREITRVGGYRPTKVDIRVIAATNRTLQEMVRDGQFRADLYYRLSVVPIVIPPLRERTEDILYFAHLFLERYNGRYGRAKRLSEAAAAALCSYAWPGNVRELENIVERLVVTVEADTIEREHLSAVFHDQESAPAPAIQVHRILPLKEAIESLEDELVRRAYAKHGSSYRAAEALGVNQSTVIRKLKRQASRSRPNISGLA